MMGSNTRARVSARRIARLHRIAYRAWVRAQEAQIAAENPCRHCGQIIAGQWPVAWENICKRCLAKHYRHDADEATYTLVCTECGRNAEDCPSYPSCELGFEALRVQTPTQN